VCQGKTLRERADCDWGVILTGVDTPPESIHYQECALAGSSTSKGG
jgi:hypothetical protein